MARKRIGRGCHKPDPQNLSGGGGFVDSIVVTPEGDNVHLNVQVTMFDPPTACIVQVYCSADNGPYLLLYRSGPPVINDLVPCTPPVYPVVFYDWYYTERTVSGELLVQSPSTRLIL